MHMRSRLLAPPPLLTEPLRRAGYAVHWPGKRDFNFEVPEGWSDSRADWTRGAVELKPPFLAYVNLGQTHEGTVRLPPDRLEGVIAPVPRGQRPDPAALRVPPYLPDEPRVRANLAGHHACASALDAEVGRILGFLRERGLEAGTLVLFVGDNGWGLPRGKRWCYDSGIRVPLLARWPGVLPAGEVRRAPVAVLDLGPTWLSVAGLPLPEPCDGIPFLGPQARERTAVVAHRDRMDETHDRIRCLREPGWSYIRNHLPGLPYAQRIAFAWETPALQAWRDGHLAGTLDPVQEAFWAPRKPVEELYDCAADPHQAANLAGRPEHAERLARMRAALDAWEAAGDLGALPEAELVRRGLVADVSARYAAPTAATAAAPAGDAGGG
jgi:uncharacterized sulfatase